MCGISGITTNNESLVKKMILNTSHRGPDNSGIYSDNSVTLGHCRLSIIDLSSNANQPMSNDNESLVISYNGEIYNYLKIRSQLQSQGISFKTNSDTEVILKLYEKEGLESFNKLKGIFAFSIWDKKKGSLIIARDPIGIKPLYYFLHDKKLIFSSELKAIYSVYPSLKIDEVSLSIYFNLGYITGPNTIWKGVKKLMPGHTLVFSNGDIKIRKYHSGNPNLEYPNKYLMKQEISQTLKKVVKQQLVGDVPVGLFLSGGIDSTLLLSLMSEDNETPINTFSSFFELDSERDNKKFNSDFYIARETSKLFGSIHHEVSISEKDLLENIEKVVWHMDEPASNSTLITNYILAKKASEYVKVVMSGEGGDEVFGGYHRYYSYRVIDFWQKIPKNLRNLKLLSRVLTYLGHERNINRLNFDNFLDLYLSFANIQEYSPGEFLQPEFYNEVEYIDFMNENITPFLNKETVFDSLINAEMNSWMLDDYINRADKMSMAHGVENRVPFLDLDIIKLSSSIRPNWKYSLINKQRGKQLLIETMNEYLPKNVISHPKTGWVSPISKWIRRGLRDIVNETLSPNYNPELKSVLNFDNINNIVENHITKKRYGAQTIWMLLKFQLWYKTFNKKNKIIS